MRNRLFWPCFGLVLVLAASARAAVDLVTIPTREGTQLTIYNSEDITMVREHRLLTVKEGVNRIQFAWTNTLIDPTSIEFRILDKQDQVELVDTTFPSGRNDALQWNIQSKFAGKIPVEIRYFTSGITWAADYVGVANEDETKLNVTGYVRVFNNSGELYDNAQTRLVVGNINLVEKIAELARRPPPGRPPRVYAIEAAGLATPAADIPAAKQWAFNESIAAAERPESALEQKKEVVKQGLSEYFLFTIEGREDIKNQEPKRLVALKADEVPLECLYKLTDRDGSQQFAKYYRFKNVKLLDENGKEKKLSGMENLGLSPLPNGMVRLFSEYKNKDLAYVGGTSTKYVPIGDRVEVNVGPDKDITIHRRLKDQKIDNVVARQYRRRLDAQFVEYYDLIDYDETFFYEEELVSGKPVLAKTEVERRFDANVYLWGPDGQPDGWNGDKAGAYVDLHTVAGRVERIDQSHVKYFLDLKPGKKEVVAYHATYKRRKMGPDLNVERRREPLGPGEAWPGAPQLVPLPKVGVIRIKAGSLASFTDSSGNVWKAEEGFEGGGTATPDANTSIGNTNDRGLYLSEHYGMSSFSREVPNGNYLVRLYFAETYSGISGPGQRVFSFNVQGHDFNDFDVWAKAGGSNRAYVESVPVEVTDGKFKVTFTSKIENPQINAIEIIPQSGR